MKDEFEVLKERIRVHQKRYAHRKHACYTKDIRRDVLEELDKSELKIADFCKGIGISKLTINRWKKLSKASHYTHESPSSFVPLAIKKENKKEVYIIKGLSFEEVAHLLRGL